MSAVTRGRGDGELAQTMTEYAVVLSVISAIIILAFGGLSSAVLGMLQQVLGVI